MAYENVQIMGADYLIESAKKEKEAAKLSGISALGSIAKSAIDYSALKTEALFAENQADQIEVQAEERANALRAQFEEAAGSAQFSAARRGVKAGEGSTAKNIEQSAIALGEDTQDMRKSAKSKAKAIRTQAKIAKKAGKGRMITGMLEGMSGVSSSAAGFKKASNLRKIGMNSKLNAMASNLLKQY